MRVNDIFTATYSPGSDPLVPKMEVRISDQQERYPQSLVSVAQALSDGRPSAVFVQQEFGCTNLFVGFGRRLDNGSSWPHCELEMGSYSGTWRILQDGKIMLGSCEVLTELEFQEKLNGIQFGKIIDITIISALDMRVSFSNRVDIEFLCCDSDEETFHCFLPHGKIAVYNSQFVWKEELPENFCCDEKRD